MTEEVLLKRLDAIDALIVEGLRAQAHSDLWDLMAELRSSQTDSAELNDWFNKLWEGFPKLQHDGTPAPHRSKTICRERMAKCCKKHKVAPEQLVKAIASYTSKCINSKTWFCGLDSLLERKAGNWLDEVKP